MIGARKKNPIVSGKKWTKGNGCFTGLRWEVENVQTFRGLTAVFRRKVRLCEEQKTGPFQSHVTGGEILT
jgi:hypothetical protein